MAKTLDEFKAKHDPLTIITRLEDELRAANAQVGLQEYVRALLGTVNLDRKIAPWLNVAPDKSDSSPGVPTLFLSDLHWGEVVQPAQVSGANEFNLKIARRRLDHTVNTAAHLLHVLSPKMKYPGIVVALGGDMISGDIHEELAETNELPSIPTVLDLHDALAPAFKYLADNFGRVFVPCVTGNHGRTHKKPRHKNRARTSFDWMLYQFLARTLATDKRITFYVPESADARYRVAGVTYNLTHGDQFKASDSIIGPIGPLMRGNQKKTARQASILQPYDVLLAGHWHQYIHLQRLIVNGSLKGYDEYADSWNFLVEAPQQALWVTHPRYGINWRMPVLCDAPAKVSKAPEWVSLTKN
jgi:hypothetical protein